MLTDQDLAKLNELFASKEDLVRLENKIESKLDNFKNEVLDGLDMVVQELKDIREEQITHAQRHEDLEKDIREIQRIPVIAHALKK